MQMMLVAGSVLLAVSSKESASGLLPVAVLLALIPRFVPGGERWRLDLRRLAVIAVVLLVFLGARLLLYGSTLAGTARP